VLITHVSHQIPMLDVAACRSIELAVVPFGTSRSPILKVMVALLGMTPTQP